MKQEIKETPIEKLPENRILKSFDNYRIVKVYAYGYKQVIYSYLVLENRKINLAGEAYFSKAIDNPNDSGQGIEQQRAYTLVQEYAETLHRILEELIK